MSDTSTTTRGWALPVLRQHPFIENGAVAFGEPGHGRCGCGKPVHRTGWEAHVADALETAAADTLRGTP